MAKTIEEFIDEGKYYFIECNYQEAQNCFIEASKLNSKFLLKSNDDEKFNVCDNEYKRKCLENGIVSILKDIESSLKEFDFNGVYWFNPNDRNFTLKQTESVAILKDYIALINDCLNVSYTFDSWAYEYKLLGDVYYNLNDYSKAYECYKKALYFNKDVGVKSRFFRLAENFGSADKLNDNDDFNYKLIDNIYFKNIHKESSPKQTIKKQLFVDGSVKEVKENRVKFDVDGETFNIENLVMDYYAKRGYKSDHCEGRIFKFFEEFIFKDIADNGFHLSDKDYNKRINERMNEFDKNNYRKIISKYYVLYKYKNHIYFDFIEYMGFDEWLGIMETIGIEKCLNLIKILAYRNKWSGWPRYGMPDLIVYNENEVFLVEVKSKNDQLSIAQIWQHMFLSDLLDIPIVIFTVNKNENQIHNIKKQYMI